MGMKKIVGIVLSDEWTYDIEFDEAKARKAIELIPKPLYERQIQDISDLVFQSLKHGIEETLRRQKEVQDKVCEHFDDGHKDYTLTADELERKILEQNQNMNKDIAKKLAQDLTKELFKNY